MAKTNEIVKELAELKHVGELLIGISDNLTKLFTEDAVEAPEVTPEAPAEPVKEYTLIDVRKILTGKSREGKTDAVKALLQKYGADKLSAVDPEKYADLVKDAEVL